MAVGKPSDSKSQILSNGQSDLAGVHPMDAPIFQVDAFTGPAARGNPAAVCILPRPAGPAWMQNVAEKMGLSETAFLYPTEQGHHLRWFTPTVEVDLCGHATLASAHILWKTGQLSPGDPARFHTRSGLLTATLQGGWIELDFPAEPEIPESGEIPPLSLLKEALGIEPKYAGKNRFDFLVEVESEEKVQTLRPNFKSLASLPARGVIVTSLASSAEYDFVSRFFAPGSGIDEDPVTGSAHCFLGPYWKGRLGKDEFVARQVSERGGVVRVRVEGDRVVLGGKSATTVQDTIKVID